ncbi:sn-glycerol-3-phosphate ABC transporter ATP-binding protein UgpC [Sporolactobacillus sp. Y61]|uniref:Sn-glycerol-3-phosphate ABC transporter ATP-binding protein UgpC n=1 Tax=Sporolactobacillus sp. Y61 TaxID=3160863 RepID=A0AAU8IGQ0_9BACL
MKQVQLVNVSKSYDGKTNVIHHIDVDVENGEFFVLVGPSGCGKSTMLRMIAGLENITSGDILIGGQPANHLPPSKRHLSMVFQNYALYPHLNVEQNITFGLYTKKISKAEQNKRCQEAADMLGLDQLLKRKPRQLSGGQRQRVALARSIVTHSPICLMDEPLSNLDAKLRAKMRSEIRQIQRKLNMTLIYVTHDQTEAMTMADRMMILNEGHVQQIGKPLDVYNRPGNRFVASFIGTPPMNLLDIEISGNSVIFDAHRKMTVSDVIRKQLNNHQITIGIRAEKIHLAQENRVTFVVEVINVEVLGTDTLITFNIKDTQWTAKWSGQWSVRVGEHIPVYLDEKDLFLFDRETGQLIYHQEDQMEQHDVKAALQ